MHKHPRRWTDEEWQDAREFVALRRLQIDAEQSELDRIRDG